MLFAVSEAALAQLSEIDSYERAVISQKKEDALAFIEEFRSSHLVSDLIESLRPEVARDVCADLPSGVSSASRACEQLPKLRVAEATAGSKEAAAGKALSDAPAAPTQPIETQPMGGQAPTPATTGSVAVAPQVVAPVVGGQSETDAPSTTAAGSTLDATTAATGSMLPSDLPQSAASPPIPIKSRPAVFVRSDSDANILAQARDGSAIVATAAGNAPLTVVGRSGDWLKVELPGMMGRAGWVHTSGLQTDAGGIKVVSATGATAPAMTSGAGTTAAPALQVASNTASAAAPSATPPSTTSAATAVTGSVPSSSDLPQSATTPPIPIKSRPVVFVRSDSDANILAQARDGSAIVATAAGNAPLTVLSRDRDWLKVVLPGMTRRAGWIHTSGLQTDAGGIKVVSATGTTAPHLTSGASTTAAPAVQVASNTAPAVAPSATRPSTTSATTAVTGSVLSSTTSPPIPIKSRPVVFVRSDTDADILAQVTEGSAIIGTAPRNAPLTVLGRYRNWLKVVLPGTTGRVGWVHTSGLQTDAGGIKVVPATGTTASP